MSFKIEKKNKKVKKKDECKKDLDEMFLLLTYWPQRRLNKI